MDRLEIERRRAERERKRRKREQVKTLALVLLTVLFVAQFMFSGLIPLPSITQFFAHMQTRELPLEVSQYAAAATPVRLSMRVLSGRYSIEYSSDVSSSAIANELTQLLTEAIGSLYEPELLREPAFALSYSMPGIWLDYLGEIPLHTLIPWSQQLPQLAVLSCKISSVLLITSDELVYVYFEDLASGEYYRAKTNVRVADINRLLESVEPNNITFAFEQEGYELLHRDTLISPLAPTPERFTLGSITASGGLERILSALSFYGRSNYTSTGYSVYREGGDTLRVTEAGDFYFTSDAESGRYRSMETVATAIEETRLLATQALFTENSAASLQLISVETRADGALELYYAYSLNGAAVLLGESGYAARFVVAKGALQEYILRPRAFLTTGERSLVLPMQQAMAVLSQISAQDENRLELIYRVQNGIVEADWETVQN